MAERLACKCMKFVDNIVCDKEMISLGDVEAKASNVNRSMQD